MAQPLWSRFKVTRALADRLSPPVRRPVLILSLPRSGSSWVGDVLGAARNALYLREPMNQLHLKSGGEETLIEFSADEVPQAYEEAARRIADADPHFPQGLGVVKNRRRWRMKRSREARVVVKEVNPLAIDWMLERLQPRLIFVVRHPAAVALSFVKLGWWGGEAGEERERHDWTKYGARLAEVLNRSVDSIERWRDSQVVQYEELCLSPVDGFRDLFDFAGLSWSEALEQEVLTRSVGGDRANTYSTSRDSREVSTAWRSEITEDALRDLRTGWDQHRLPWYQADDEW